MREYMDNHLVTAAWVAISGAATWLAMTTGHVLVLDPVSDLRIVTAAAGLAGWIVAPLFKRGLICVFLGAVMSTAAGSAIAGAAFGFLDSGGDAVLLGALFGVMGVAHSMTNFGVFAVWLITMAVTSGQPDAVNSGSSDCP